MPIIKRAARVVQKTVAPAAFAERSNKSCRSRIATANHHTDKSDFHCGRLRAGQSFANTDQAIYHRRDDDQHEHGLQRRINVVIDDDTGHLGYRLSRRYELARGE
jgi:hypothetical protein